MSASEKLDIDSEKHGGDSAPSISLQEDATEIDLATFHELHAGRLVIDPAYETPLLQLFSPHPTI